MAEIQENKIFTDENTKEEFKDLCIAVLPHIRAIMKSMQERSVKVMSSIAIKSDGYFCFGLHESKMEMMSRGSGEPVEIRYDFLKDMEVLDYPKMEYSRTAENLAEISMVFAELQIKHKGLSDGNVDWKQKFVEWANEFEVNHLGLERNDGDYPDEIRKFAIEKIMVYACSQNILWR